MRTLDLTSGGTSFGAIIMSSNSKYDCFSNLVISKSVGGAVVNGVTHNGVLVTNNGEPVIHTK